MIKNNIKSSRIVRLQDVFSVYVSQINVYGFFMYYYYNILKSVWNVDYNIRTSANLMES